MKTAGIDGCKAGWMLISFDEEPHYKVLRSDEELEEAFNNYDRILIDMPIGMEDENYTRVCDELLRKKLGGEYASSVFSPPIRPALHAPSYVEANIESYEYTEKKLTVQAWNITPKIKTIDKLLQENPEFLNKVYESHPELLFMNLNGGTIYQKKATKKGLRHRLDLVSNHEKIAADFFREIKEEFRRNEVGEADIVDSMVLALAAKKSVTKNLKTIPESPANDSQGIKMAIHYV